MKPLFEVGRVFIEIDVLRQFTMNQIEHYLEEHAMCEMGPCSDWSDANELSLLYGGPMFSMFRNKEGYECSITTEPGWRCTWIQCRRPAPPEFYEGQEEDVL